MKRTFSKLSAALSLVALSLGVVPSASAGEPVGVVVLKEHGAGSASSAQGYIDALMAVVAKRNNWADGATGKYFTKRDAASSWAKANHPHYGIMSLAAFLALRGEHGLTVVGQATVSGR